MQGSFDINLNILTVGTLVFECTKGVSKIGNEYYKVFNSDKIHVGGFKIDPISNKITGGLTHHVELVFSSYQLDNIVFKKLGFGGKRYRMSRNKATDVAVKRRKS